jgi:acetyl-CoA carboxylase biotin carboxyl carrier protein
MDEVDIRQIVALVEALDRSSFDSLHLDFGHFKLTLGKGGAIAEQLAIAQGKGISAPIPAPVSSAAWAPRAAAPPIPPGGVTAAEKRPGDAATDDTIGVRAPIMGLFYSKPDPGSPPFVSPGTEVHEGTTVGLIEVMKVFNAVQAGAKGIIAEICVDNGQMVEIGQTLFRIRPNEM